MKSILSLLLVVVASIAIAACDNDTSREEQEHDSIAAEQVVDTTVIVMPTVSDGELKTNLEKRLGAEPGFRKVAVAIDSGSVVAITGTVKSEELKKKAQTIVEGTEGVYGVENALRVQ